MTEVRSRFLVDLLEHFRARRWCDGHPPDGCTIEEYDIWQASSSIDRTFELKVKVLGKDIVPVFLEIEPFPREGTRMRKCLDLLFKEENVHHWKWVLNQVYNHVNEIRTG